MSSLTAITAGPVAIAPRRARLAVLLGVVVALVFALAPPLAVAQPQPQPHTDPARSDRIPHPEDPDMQIWFYRCNHRSPVELNPLITRYKSAAGQVIDYPENNTLLIVDTPERMKLLARILRQADVPRAQVMIEVKVISLTYSSDFQLGAESTWDLASKT
ncbi:MAG: secretin N-terminal domain-containing protein, partial [Planctomycetota bacterium]